MGKCCGLRYCLVVIEATKNKQRVFFSDSRQNKETQLLIIGLRIIMKNKSLDRGKTRSFYLEDLKNLLRRPLSYHDGNPHPLSGN